MGPYGYAAPDYLATGHLTAKSDVYSFGVVLLELLSGRRVVDKNQPTGEHNLVEWARPYLSHQRKVLQILDRHLEGQFSLGTAQKLAALALQCLAVEARFRPNMSKVLSTMVQLQDDVDLSRGPQDELNSNNQNLSSVPSKPRRSLDETGKAAYTRPSASPLYS